MTIRPTQTFFAYMFFILLCLSIWISFRMQLKIRANDNFIKNEIAVRDEIITKQKDLIAEQNKLIDIQKQLITKYNEFVKKLLQDKAPQQTEVKEHLQSVL